MNREFCVALCVSAIATFLPACGASQNATTLPQGLQARKGLASGGDLLYAVGGNVRTPKIHVYTFPAFQQISRLGNAASGGLCSDSSGNIFMPKYQAIDEYAHGGKHPIKTLKDPYYVTNDCSVDPTSGNLAIANLRRQSGPGNIVIYDKAQGSPIAHSDPQIYRYWSCGYDGTGNLFVLGLTAQNDYQFAELPKGGDTFTNITVNNIGFDFSSVRWDGQYIVLKGSQAQLYRIQVSGSTATVVGKTTLWDIGRQGITDFWIQGDVVAATGWNVGLWHYPKGRKPFQLSSTRAHNFTGVTVSVASSRESNNERLPISR